MAACANPIDPKVALLQAAAGGAARTAERPQARPTAATVTDTMTNYNGPVIQSAMVTNVFWGSFWDANGSANTLRLHLNRFQQALPAMGDYVGVLQQYTGPGGSLIGPSFFQGDFYDPTNPSAVLTDAQIQSELQTWISANLLPAPSESEVYAVFLPPGVTVTWVSNLRSCTDFCSYHSSSSDLLRYLVIPYTCSTGVCATGLGPFDALTAEVSRALANAQTDPDAALAPTLAAPAAWEDGVRREVASICPDSSAALVGDFYVGGLFNQLRQTCDIQSHDLFFNLTASLNSPLLTVAGPAVSMEIDVIPFGLPAAQALPFTIAGTPAGILATFVPPSLDLASGKVTLSLSAAAGTAPGVYPISVLAGTGPATTTAGMRLTVQAAGDDFAVNYGSLTAVAYVTIAPTGLVSFPVEVDSTRPDLPVTLSATGLPPGMSAAFEPPVVTGTGTSKVTLTSTNVTATGFNMAVVGTSGTLVRSRSIQAYVSSPNESLSALPSEAVLVPGSSTRMRINTESSGTFGPLALDLQGAPGCLSWEFDPPTLTSGTGGSWLTLFQSPICGVIPGTSSIIVLMKNDFEVGQRILFDLSVVPPGPADFALVDSPAAISVAQGTQGYVYLSANTINNWTADIGLSGPTPLPAGVTATLSSPALYGASGSSTLAFTAAADAPLGTTPVTITATGPGTTHSQVISVTVTPAPDFTFSANPSTLSVAPGNNVTTTVLVTPVAGYSYDVVPATGPYAAGVFSAFFNPQRITGANGSSLLTMHIAAGSTPGTESMTLSARGDDGTVHTFPITLNITGTDDFTLLANPNTLTLGGSGNISSIGVGAVGAFAGTVTLTTSGLPAGVTSAFSGTVQGAGSATLTVTAPGTPPAPGSYPFTVVGTSGNLTHSASVTLVVPAPDFSVAANPASLAFAAGQSQQTHLTISRTGGFTSALSAQVIGALPAGITAQLSATSGIYGQVDLAVDSTDAVAAQNTSVSVVLTSGSLSHTVQVPVSVTAAPPDLHLASDALTLPLSPGGSANVVLHAAALNGFNAAVALMATTSSADLTWSFGPDHFAAPGSGDTTLTVTLAANTTATTIYLDVSAAGGGRTAGLRETISVVRPDFSISVPQARSLAAGGQVTVPVTLTEVQGFEQPVTLSLQGLPDGVSGSFSPATLASGVTSSTLTLSAILLAQASTATLTVTGVGGGLTRTASFSLSLTAATDIDFSLTANPVSLTIAKGASGTTTLTVTSIGGFNQNVTFQGEPSNGQLASTFARGIVIGGAGQDTLTISPSASMQAGPYTVVVQATGQGKTHMVNVDVTVVEPGVRDFSISLDPGSLTAAAGSSPTVAITETPASAAFSDPVTLAALDLPVGVTAAFQPLTIPATGSVSTLTLIIDQALAPQTFTAQIQASATGLVHRVPLTVTVTAPASFSLALDPAALTITEIPESTAPSQPQTTTLTVAFQAPFSQAVALSLASVPPGIAGTFTPSTLTSSGTATLSVTAAAVTPGNYEVTVVGTAAGGVTHQASLRVTTVYAGTGPGPQHGCSTGALSGQPVLLLLAAALFFRRLRRRAGSPIFEAAKVRW